MWRHPLLSLLIGGYVAWGAWDWVQNRPVRAPDGMLAPDDPQQADVPDGETLRIRDWTLKVRAHYRITARVLGLERYRFDALASLIPEDLAFGWGFMSDNESLKAIDISQSNRFYYWRETAPIAVSRESIISHSANTHVIPLDGHIAAQLSHLHPGQVVTLVGDLVDGKRDDGASLHTSLTRTDTGPGACEVMLVREVEVAR
ncbi:MAG TPA: hypothetical protein VK437_03235 [Steroidobacteraceae bacterium]|nr:hypothetical protein [Steroidobacteraceae bacterium]